ncbi:OmpA family protein [Bradyrhizobium sp. B097]|uniref:OmpA family protein n=1 Tax=Bradyrhizobium sp. B097 TaxID=3140244 RepID=UPI0031830D8D
MDLSSRRAQSVATALTQDYAFAAGRLTASGAGPTMRGAPNDTEEGRAKNRRVELVAK